MRKIWLFLLVLATAATGCGGDDAPADDGGVTDSGGDAAAANYCAAFIGATVPDGDALMNPCCYRVSNADRLDAPELRMTYMNVTEPAALSSAVILGSLNRALIEERFNWLIRLVGASADGDVTVETGFGWRDEATSNYSFAVGDAIGGTDPNRWDRVSTTGTLASDNVTFPALDAPLTVPVFNEDGTVLLELPLYGVQLETLTMTEGRTCVGSRLPRSFSTGDGSLFGYVRMEDAALQHVVVSPLDTSLCGLLANESATPFDDGCPTTPQGDWGMGTGAPDSLCTGTTCTDVCDPATDCNAWRITTGFSAAGVEITN